MIVDGVRTRLNNLNDNKKDWIYLGLPILISLIIKLVLLAALYNNPVNNDGTLYINAARQYALGNFAKGFMVYQMPAYPLLLAFVHMVIPNWVISGYLISLFSMILVTIPLFYLIKIMFNSKVAFWGCVVFAILPKVNDWSFDIIRDPLFLLLFISSVYFALRSVLEKDSILFVTTIIFAWLSTLIRIEGVIFIGFYWFVLIYNSIADKENRTHFSIRSFVWIGIPLGIVLIALLSGSVRNLAFNRFDTLYSELVNFFSGDFLNKSRRIYDTLSEISGHKPFKDGHYSFITLCKHFIPLIYLLGILQAILKVLFPLSIIPLYFGFKAKVNTYMGSGKFIFGIWIFFIGFAYYAIIDHDFIPTRWLMIPAILLLPWVGCGINQLIAKANTFTYRKLILCLISLIILAPAIKSFALISSRDVTTSYAVKWLKKNDKINKVPIVSNNFKDSFHINLAAHADSDWKVYYYKKQKISYNIEKFAQKKHAKIIIYKFKTKNKGKISNFQFYEKVTSITGNKYTTMILRLKE